MAKRGRQRTGEAEGEAGGALPALRHTRLIETLRERGQATVNELVALFGVSHDTIRRDLDLLERRGLLVRTHGGAVDSDRLVRLDSPLLDRMDEHIDAKRRIGAAAAALIRDGETLIVNGGSTVCQFGAALGERRDLTVVTNNLRLPPAVPDSAIGAIHILGGTYWPQFQVTIGPVGFAPAAGIHADTAILGCSGVSASGVSMTKLEEAAQTSAMIDSARRTIILADRSKFGVQAFANAAALERIDQLVTDAPPPAELGAALARAGVELIICGP